MLWYIINSKVVFFQYEYEYMDRSCKTYRLGSKCINQSVNTLNEKMSKLNLMHAQVAHAAQGCLFWVFNSIDSTNGFLIICQTFLNCCAPFKFFLALMIRKRCYLTAVWPLQIKTAGENNKGSPISFLAASKSMRNALLTISGGSVRLFDIRDSKVSATLSLRSSKSLVSASPFIVLYPYNVDRICL